MITAILRQAALGSISVPEASRQTGIEEELIHVFLRSPLVQAAVWLEGEREREEGTGNGVA